MDSWRRRLSTRLAGLRQPHVLSLQGSGSKVLGILGTGTCAIGNFVIVDTTTNGRVKCTAVRPVTVDTLMASH